MSSRLLVVLVALAGCDWVAGLRAWPDASTHPVLPDSDLVPIDSGPCDGTIVGMQPGRANGLLSTCVPQTAPAMTVLPALIDTTDPGSCNAIAQRGGTELCLIWASKITTSTAVHIVGTRPLVLIGIDQVMIDHDLDLSSPHAANAVGAGADFQGCAGGAGATNAQGGGGGAGGSFAFGLPGGHGGGGGNAGGGFSNTPVSPDRIRGGCAGAAGGDGNNGDQPASGGAGGPSGGAVYILSNGRIDVGGNIDASGGAGGGGATGRQSAAIAAGGGGGGGGGSGGMIAFDAPAVNVQPGARVFANGGGGGGAGGISITGSQVDGGAGGEDTDPALFGVAAPGGQGGDTTAGDGGTGSALALPGGSGAAGTTDASGASSGGGGGGGAGYILVYTTGAMPVGLYSPQPYINGQ